MTSRAIATVIEIVSNEEISARRRIEACDSLLGYESPPEIVQLAKEFLTKTFEDSEVEVADRLDALKLMRKIEAAKVTPLTVLHQERGNRSPRDVASLRDFTAALEVEFGDHGHAAEGMGRRLVLRQLRPAR